MIDPRAHSPGPSTPRLPRTFLRRRASVTREIARFLAALRAEAAVGLHLGAGTSRLEGMINCDLFALSADRRIDARDLSDFADGSVDLIEHHHMAEHLSIAEFDRAAKEWARVLRPDGHLVMTCPDLLRLCVLYLANATRDRLRPSPDRLDCNVKMFVGSQEHEGMFHKNHFDERRLKRLLPEYGFGVDFCYAPYPMRPTPSLLTVARRMT